MASNCVRIKTQIPTYPYRPQCDLAAISLTSFVPLSPLSSALNFFELLTVKFLDYAQHEAEHIVTDLYFSHGPFFPQLFMSISVQRTQDWCYDSLGLCPPRALCEGRCLANCSPSFPSQLSCCFLDVAFSRLFLDEMFTYKDFSLGPLFSYMALSALWNYRFGDYLMNVSTPN